MTTPLPESQRVEWGYTPEQVQGWLAERDARIAVLQADLDEWRFTNTIDELQRSRDALQAGVERLQREFVNRNQRALDGDKEIALRESRLAEIDALRQQLEAAQKDAEPKHSDLCAWADKVYPTMSYPLLLWRGLAMQLERDLNAALAATKGTKGTTE